MEFKVITSEEEDAEDMRLTVAAGVSALNTVFLLQAEGSGLDTVDAYVSFWLYGSSSALVHAFSFYSLHNMPLV